MKLTRPVTWALALAIVAGVLEYLNAVTFGFSPAWHNAIKYGIFLVSLTGVTAATGRQLGADIADLLHLSPAVLTVAVAAAATLAGAVTTFSISGTAKGIILGVVAFITSCFGVAPSGTTIAAHTAPVATTTTEA